MPFKDIRDILEEHGIEPTEEAREPIPDWQELGPPSRRWLTFGDVLSGGGNMISLLAAILQYFIAISIWSLVVLILLLTVLRMLGCK